MKLETERLVLKEIHEGHIEDILRIRSNEIINQYVKRNSPKTNYDALEFILHIKRKTQNKEIVFWGISYKDTPNLIGTICLWKFSEDRKTAEVGYELLPEYHRKGLMSEALNAVLNYGYNELQLLEVLAITSRFNENSKQLLLKYHFTLEEDQKDKDNPDNIIFSLKRD
ncbi:N-acetyltransferase [Chryseobacterium sp. G0162]|uniref:GNAT family N-acetyltransferase n=1 Tax=Chryseobacterium sp. G0162 TaxID=2487063 RepID=UPI000F4E79EB|nr:GNAT family N-acetyltransferase [Chryseobacterium sp. G0162]AZB11851.1 N-acetyltransferase [Chryseobacterium sp. G0162]